ncbi:MAG: hypothetical protein AB8H79_01380 [Myxococcota bacterium]
MNFRLTPLALVLAAGCAPQNASIVEGSYTMFMSNSTTQVFIEDRIRVDNFEDKWVIDCLGRDERAEGAIDNCRDSGGVNVPVEGADRGIAHETWIERDVFTAVHEPLDPWRGEAIMTSEDDLQLTFHHRLPNGDFRFAVVVDPAFQPRTCVEDESGNLSNEPIDGDWVAEYTKSMTQGNYDGGESLWTGRSNEGTLFLLNATTFQFNPDSTDNIWVLPFYMEAGYAAARWGPESMSYQGARWAQPSAYTAYADGDRNGPPTSSVFYERFDPNQFQGEFEPKLRADPDFKALYEKIEKTARETQEDISALYAPGIEVPDYTPAVPSEAWRRPDGTDAGFDGWGGMYHSYVRFDQDRDLLKAGERLSGEFKLYFFGDNSQSRLLVEGQFETGRVKNDTWVTPNVQEEKLEESGLTLCGGEAEAE